MIRCGLRHYSARAVRLQAQAQAHLAAAQPERAESLLRAALATADANDAALKARLNALLADATTTTTTAMTNNNKKSVFASVASAAALERGEAARLLANAAEGAAGARQAHAAVSAAFGGESVEAALALSNVGVWLARERSTSAAVDALRDALAILARLVGSDNGAFAAVAANLRVLGHADVVAQVRRECDAAMHAVAEGARALDIAQIERLDERAALWSRLALPGRLDPDGLVMDAAFTRRVLTHFFAVNPSLAADGRLFDWVSRESTLHGIRNDDMSVDDIEDDDANNTDDNVDDK
jgi:hypothetical protein